ncbi:MAG TPA: hypothetical protein VGF59_08695, partial [Bryobacteraceae bacterium]
MLKITLHDSARELRIQLEGRLSGPWVAELRQCWRTAASTTVGRPTVVDLRDVDFVDSPGESLLADMHRAGVRLEASTPLIDDLVRSICAGRCATVEENWHSSNAVVC